MNLPARERRIGMLFQHYNLFPHRTVKENIAFGLRDLPEQERERRVAALVERTHIGGSGKSLPAAIVRRRAATRSASASLGDSARSAAAGRTAFRAGHASTKPDGGGATEHIRSICAAVSVGDAQHRRSLPTGRELLVLAKGKVAAFGAKDEIFSRPPSLEVAQLTGCKNFSRARAIDGKRSRRSTGVAGFAWRNR